MHKLCIKIVKKNLIYPNMKKNKGCHFKNVSCIVHGHTKSVKHLKIDKIYVFQYP